MSIPRILGMVRIGAGVALTAAPRPISSIIVAPESESPIVPAAWRMIGGRDLALGAALVSTPEGGVGQRALLGLNGMVDLVDAASLIAVGAHLKPSTRWLWVAMGLTSAAAHITAAALVGAKAADAQAADAQAGR